MTSQSATKTPTSVGVGELLNGHWPLPVIAPGPVLAAFSMLKGLGMAFGRQLGRRRDAFALLLHAQKGLRGQLARCRTLAGPEMAPLLEELARAIAAVPRCAHQHTRPPAGPVGHRPSSRRGGRPRPRKDTRW